MRISRELVDEIIRHAEISLPYECCGLIGSIDGRAITVYRMTNVASDPENFFEMDLRQHYETNMLMLDRGEQMGGIYHSHPDRDATPSDSDTALAFYEVPNLIVGLKPELEVRAYLICEGEVEELELDLLPA